ncbi:Hypothetical predicted protein [Mytilus galloprovincialis]|uniref:Uncharacterized protein n=1 Tax=Mytilus galloprovincialis TaxID=29158 RepID=A0A8B6GE86_MYTGA|nr:Hypothetical predicted protein [Mytilus galloprovincialis]
MRPLNLDECWICQQQFPDQKTLKRHLAKDYRRIVTKVTPKGSPSAVQARSNVTSWLGKCKSIRRLRQSWVEDWANHPRDTDVVGTPRQGIREPSVESAVSEWEQDVSTITLEEDAPMKEYGPLISLFTIRSKEMIWYRIEIDPVIRMVEKFNAALERKANTIRPTDISTMSHSGSPVYGEEFYHKQQMCADTLNISPALITRIERRPDIFSSVSKTKPIVAPTNSPLAPTNQSPSATSSVPKSPSSQASISASKPSSAPKSHHLHSSLHLLHPSLHHLHQSLHHLHLSLHHLHQSLHHLYPSLHHLHQSLHHLYPSLIICTKDSIICIQASILFDSQPSSGPTTFKFNRFDRRRGNPYPEEGQGDLNPGFHASHTTCQKGLENQIH